MDFKKSALKENDEFRGPRLCAPNGAVVSTTAYIGAAFNPLLQKNSRHFLFLRAQGYGHP
jgi:hypothetical protein